MMLEVDNIFLLRSTLGKEGMSVFTKGYYSPEDGGHNSFYWDENYNGIDNQATIIKVSNVDSGAWRAYKNKKKHTRQFGIKGNGVESDGNKIRKMLSILKDDDEIEFGKGIYIIDDFDDLKICLLIDKNIKIFSKEQAVIKCIASGARAVIRLSASVHLENIMIDCNFKANHAIECIQGAYGSVIKDCLANNASQYYNTKLSAALYVVVSEVNISFINCVANLAVAAVNKIIGDVHGTARGFHFYGKSKIHGENLIDGCMVNGIVNNRGADKVYEDEDGIVSQLENSTVRITNCIIKNCMKRGIKTQDPAYIANNYIITNRESYSLSGRMYAAISIYSNDVIVFNNKIDGTDNAGNNGYYIYAVEIGIKDKVYENIKILNNKFFLKNDFSIHSFSAVYICGVVLNCIIESNSFKLDKDNIFNTSNAILAVLDDNDISSIIIYNNFFNYFSSAINITGPWSGEVSNNKLANIKSKHGGIVIYGYQQGEASSRLTFSNNKMFFSEQYLISIYTNRVGDMFFVGNTASDVNKIIYFDFFCACMEDALLFKTDKPSLFYYCFVGKGKTYR